MNNKLKETILIVLDALIINLAVFVSIWVRFEFHISDTQFIFYWNIYLKNALPITAINLLSIAAFSLYQSLWKYVSVKELVKCACAAIVGGTASISYLVLVGDHLPRSIYLMASIFVGIGIGAIRFAYRVYREYRMPGLFNIRDSENPEARILLVGCGDAGSNIIRETKQHKSEKNRIIAAIDDNKSKIGQRINGVKIVGTRNDIPNAVEKYKANQIIIAIPTASKKDIQEIAEICQKTKCKVQIMPSLNDLINEKVSIKSLRDIDIEDLLGRDPVVLNNTEIAKYLNGQVVMVTGGGGSIGSELVRQVAKFGPRQIVVCDIYENSSFELQQEMRRTNPDLDLEVSIANVADKARMTEVFKQFKPSIVFHAAAHKHVPLMEDSPREAILNNVLGTNNCMDLALEFDAKKFILISTDKAVNPTSVMGATKRICEMLMQEHAAKSQTTEFVAVRFGNVLGSNGSVIPTFRKQIAAGGPVTVTHKEITRYFMTIPEAVQLVIQAGSMAKGGEIFILDMGEPVKILDLAEKLIRLSGSEPYTDIDIKFTGLRPGEKLYEELLLSEEGIKETSHNKIFIGHPVPASEGLNDLLKTGIEKGINDLSGKTNIEIREWIRTVVPNYSGGGN